MREPARLFATVAFFIFSALGPRPSAAQSAAQSPSTDDPFARGSWNLELSLHGAAETWNYNTSREEIYGLNAGLTYGIGQGIVLTARAPLYYVSQRGVDGLLFGVTGGIRGRVHRHNHVSFFLEVDVGISESDTIVPPRGTRFNYLAMGGGGVTFRLRRGVHVLAAMRWAHVSNGGRAGRDRNPDIEAVGPQLGLLLGF